MTHLIHQATARFMLAVAACMLLLGFASSASAQQTIYETISVAQTEQLLKKEGYSSSYIDKDGDPVLELDLNLEGGVTEKRIVDFLLTSRVSYLAWRKEVL